jgi:FAD/FMN-containing dehydrogenase
LQQVYDSLAPLSDGAYANYSDKSLSDWRTAYYGAHLERLTSVKRQFDPDGFFSHPLSL